MNSVIKVAPSSTNWVSDPEFSVDDVFIKCIGTNYEWLSDANGRDYFRCTGDLQMISVAPVQSSIAGSNYGFVTWDGYALIFPALVSLVVVIGMIKKLQKAG